MSGKNVTTYLNKILPRAQQIGYAVPYDLFVSMTNPKNRGPKWDWNNFIDRAVKMTEVTCWQPFTDKEWKSWEKEIKEDAMRTAKIHAEKILSDSGILEWGTKIVSE